MKMLELIRREVISENWRIILKINLTGSGREGVKSSLGTL